MRNAELRCAILVDYSFAAEASKNLYRRTAPPTRWIAAVSAAEVSLSHARTETQPKKIHWIASDSSQLNFKPQRTQRTQRKFLKLRELCELRVRFSSAAETAACRVRRVRALNQKASCRSRSGRVFDYAKRLCRDNKNPYSLKKRFIQSTHLPYSVITDTFTRILSKNLQKIF